MKDRLTKKRVKVDYEAIIKLLDLCYAFRCYHVQRRFIEKKPWISQRREMCNFLKSRRVDLYWCSVALKDGCTNLIELCNYCGGYSAAMEYAYGM